MENTFFIWKKTVQQQHLVNPTFWSDVFSEIQGVKMRKFIYILTFLKNKQTKKQKTPSFNILFNLQQAWTNRYTQELTGNTTYLCHFSNWNRTTLIDHAGCNTIKT